MRLIFLFLLSISSLITTAQNADEKQIRDILDRQTNAWNRGDLDNFVVGYWKSDSLMFIGKSGVTYGWENTLNNYKKSYPDTSAMGKLAFTILHVTRLNEQYYQVVGKWALSRSVGNVSGHYTLLFKKINGEWVIISDHSS